MDANNKKQTITERPPVVVVMGHIDHGKSTLLDYIRQTNVTQNEAGGITQNISAYEVEVPSEEPKSRENEENRGIPRLARDDFANRKITFLDTPGHEAFSKMRQRGAIVADIAILVVSGEDGVKPQTIEAWKTIHESNTPCIVAINKIDKPGCNIEKTKTELAENEIYLENYGGKIPSVEISAKTGLGIDNLLSLILILAEMENFTGDLSENASGLVIESNLDPKRGVEATLLIKNGTLEKGMTIAVEDAMSSVRLIEDFKGTPIETASFSSPVRIFGFDKVPKVGGEFRSFKNKKDAGVYVENFKNKNTSPENNTVESNKKIIPILLKADVSGSLEAIEKEIYKIKCKGEDSAEFRIISKGIGPISEGDIKNISDSKNMIVIGFNVKADKNALELIQKRELPINFFNIIYKMTEWLEEEMEKRRPRVETIETTGKAKIIRAFSRTKERQIVGGKVLVGKLVLNGTIKIIRREFEIGRGKIVNLEKNKVKTSTVDEGSEFGMMVESKMEIAEGDTIELFSIEQK
jgi:translation initiation factor IF-2